MTPAGPVPDRPRRPHGKALPLLALILLLAGLLLWWQHRAGDTSRLARSRLLMGTVVEIAASGLPRPDLDMALDRAFAEMARIEGLMKPDGDESEVARLSRAPSEAEISPETARVLALGQTVARASGGAFDLTLGRLKALWGVESEHPRVPDPAEIAEALAGTGPDALAIDGLRVVKSTPGLAVDLGGIAKGYALDRAAEVLNAAGVSGAAINAGGDLRLLGDAGGRPWKIGIQHPRDPGRLLAILSLAEGAVVTSGDYERFFERDGIRYHHLFDPATGRPARRCQSVTVVAGNAALADALATAVFVLGPEKGLALLAGFSGSAALVIDAAGTPHLSPGLEERLEWP